MFTEDYVRHAPTEYFPLFHSRCTSSLQGAPLTFPLQMSITAIAHLTSLHLLPSRNVHTLITPVSHICLKIFCESPPRARTYALLASHRSRFYESNNSEKKVNVSTNEQTIPEMKAQVAGDREFPSDRVLHPSTATF